MILFYTIIVVSLTFLILGTLTAVSNIGLFLLPIIFTIPFSPLPLLKPRHFVVIGPLGVYYQKIIKKGSFSWDNVSEVAWGGADLFPTKSVVNIYFPNHSKVAFSSQWYLNKEFPKKVRRRMFVNLFYFYFKLGQNKKLQSSIKEYEKLLERKNKGEYVDDKIKQNHYTVKMKKTILIIEDELAILALVTKFMMLGDFETVICSNAKEALRVIEERYNDITMILLDPMMPGFNMEKFLQSVKSDERYKHILVRVLPEIIRLQEEKAKESLEKIKSIMKNESINELTIQRQYLPEIFGFDLLEISKDDGLPILKLFVNLYLFSKGIYTEIFGNIIKLKKTKPPISFFELLVSELQAPKEKGDIKHKSRDIKHIDSKLRDEIQSFLNWIKDSEGLAGYINYYLKQNNPQVISKLSRIYNELKQITTNGIQKTKKMLPKERFPYNIDPLIPKITYESVKKFVFKEHKINEYITLKLEDKKTQIYVNGKRFLQCMRLFLQIPPQESNLYEEIESIDEATQVYKQSLFESRIVEGPMARPSRFQNTTITPEQEFWGHCSNLQAWVEHNYDTRLLMSNISFPLLKKLTVAGDPLARKVFKEEIAQRLESGYPSVVQYLIVRGYISHFTPFELKTIIDTTNLIKVVSAQPKMLSDFLQTCANMVPTILWDIVLKILEFPEGKENLYTASSRKSWELPFRVPLDSNPRFLDKIKEALIDKLNTVRKDKKGDILDYIQIIDDNVNEKKREIEAKNFEVERAELKKIVKSVNLKRREMLEEYHQERDTMIQNLTLEQFVKERMRIPNYLQLKMAPIIRIIYKLQDKLKRKLRELEKIKNKGEDVSDLIRQTNNLMRLTNNQRKKIYSFIKKLTSGLLKSMRKDNS